MILNIIIFFGLLIYLFFLNLNQIRFNLCLDKSSNTEKHKLLLELNNKTPISGSFFFLPLILYLNY